MEPSEGILLQSRSFVIIVTLGPNHRVTITAELASAISDAGLTYPVFVKPQSGAAHEGMSMVSGEARLLPALRAAGYPAVIQVSTQQWSYYYI